MTNNPASTQTTRLPGGKHDPDAGRSALVMVTGACADLRPDLAATLTDPVLTKGSGG